MNKINALGLRQGLGRVLKQLEKGGAPIYVERNHQPVAVLVSLKDFQERFADRKAQAEREQLVREIHEFRERQTAGGSSPLSLLRELRAGR